MKKKVEINDFTKVLIPAKGYNVDEDKRLLIPYTYGKHIGFMNHDMEMVVYPKYIMYDGECYSEHDLIKVAVEYNHGYLRANNNIAAYSTPIYGLINYKGEVIIEPENRSLIISKCCKETLLTIQRKDYKYGVINLDGEEIIPFGKYGFIDGFYKGLARIKINKYPNEPFGNGVRWGIINEHGEEVMPCIHNSIWNFYNKNYKSIIVVDNGSQKYIPFNSLLNNSDNYSSVDYQYNSWDEYETYNEYNGSYAQDVMGYSDQAIGDAFDGDPDAYWNID